MPINIDMPLEDYMCYYNIEQNTKLVLERFR